MKRIYVAGPYTGDVGVNMHEAMKVGLQLIEMGYAPFIPHLYHFLHLQKPLPYETWMAVDFEWVTSCDAVLRLPGVSPGADREVALARSMKIPVFESLDFLWDIKSETAS